MAGPAGGALATARRPAGGGRHRQRFRRPLHLPVAATRPRPAPAVPYEVAVTVRLDDESGAAGLIFHADGGDKHYGFYPSGGQLRLTRFEGPDVLTWKILNQEASPHYKPGDWNTLKVRIEKDR